MKKKKLYYLIAGLAILSIVGIPIDDVVGQNSVDVDGVVVGGAILYLDADDSSLPDWVLAANGNGSFGLASFGATVNFPFALEEGAASGSFLVDSNGDILMAAGMNTLVNGTGPDAALHILRGDMSTGLSGIKVEDASTSVVNRDLMELVNNGGVRFALDNLDRNERWEFSNNTIGDFNINRAGTGGPEMRVTRTGRLTSGPGGFAALDSRPNGNLFIAGTLFESSDREKKENFKEVDCDAILKQVEDLSITTWNFKSDKEAIRHMGPVSQDFRNAFQLGDSDKTIATTDKIGVSLAAIKALNSKLKDKDGEIETLDLRVAKKEERIEALESELEEMDARMKRLETLLEQAAALAPSSF